MNQEKHFIVDILFVLALFGVFAVSSLVLVTIGADVYQHTIRDMNTNYETRAAASYLTEKFRQNISPVEITTLSEEPVLKLSQEIDGEVYFTYLYLYDGCLMELFVRENASLGGNALEAGEKIMDLSEFSFSPAGLNLLDIRLTTPSGEKHQLYLATPLRVS